MSGWQLGLAVVLVLIGVGVMDGFVLLVTLPWLRSLDGRMRQVERWKWQQEHGQRAGAPEMRSRSRPGPS